jgi:uncharacterized protein
MDMLIAKRDVELEIRNYPNKGRGVSARQPIQEGTVLESLPVLIIESQVYKKLRKFPFIKHTFVWDIKGKEKSGAIGFGFASMCNHSENPNAAIRKDFENNAIELVAIKNIQPEEEVTFKYHKTFFDVY